MERTVHPARFIDVGVLAPAWFHAAYAGIAAAAAADARPVVMWGQARPHISLGQSQSRHAELVAELEVPAVTRPLGGGAVWIDESQYCFVLITPRAHAPPRPADWFAWGLAPAIATFRQFGLVVGRREQDLWLDGRKIAGSGAATIGGCAVFASSFLLHFPAERFARCIAGPLSARGREATAFRSALVAALGQAMTDWASHRAPPAAGELRGAFCRAVERTHRWRLARSTLNAVEIAAQDEALEELAESGRGPGGRLVANGLKLNAAAFLTERRAGGQILREVSIDGTAAGRTINAS